MSAPVQLDVVCSVPGCGRLRDSHKLCKGHVARLKNGLEVNAPLRRYGAPAPSCSVIGCVAPAYGRGRCRSHYRRLLRRLAS